MEKINILYLERDALAFLGMMAYMYLNWDPPIRTGDKINDVTHFKGLNICALIIDNQDGEVLALKKNSIHSFSSPVQHAEQLAVRKAIDSLRSKRPRSNNLSVEEYYRSQLFYGKGSLLEDYIRKGCTLYTSLEPCPMCTATLCACRMKRVVYMIPDYAYGGSWNWRQRNSENFIQGQVGIKEKYYPKYALNYIKFELPSISGILFENTHQFLSKIIKKIGTIENENGSLRKMGVYDTLFFDFLHDDLKSIFEFFCILNASHLKTEGNDKKINILTLKGLKKCCNIPF